MRRISPSVPAFALPLVQFLFCCANFGSIVSHGKGKSWFSHGAANPRRELQGTSGRRRLRRPQPHPAPQDRVRPEPVSRSPVRSESQEVLSCPFQRMAPVPYALNTSLRPDPGRPPFLLILLQKWIRLPLACEWEFRCRRPSTEATRRRWTAGEPRRLFRMVLSHGPSGVRSPVDGLRESDSERSNVLLT